MRWGITMKRMVGIMVCLVSGLALLWNYNGEHQDNFARKNEKEKKITLTVLAGQSTSDPGIEEMINHLIQENCPEINLEWECVGWGEQFSSAMRTKFAAGEVPDIMIGKAQDVVAFAPSGNLAPLTGPYVSYVLDASLPAVTMDNKIYGLSYNAFYQGVIYNKDIFNQYGIQVPKTQDELKEVIKKLKDENITPFASNFQDIWSIGNMTMQFAMNEVFNKYPNWGDLFREGKVSFLTSKEFRNCFEYNKEIYDATWEDAMAVNQSEADTRFANGEAAMYLTGTWALQTINEINPNMNLGIFPYPNTEGDAKLIFEPNMTFMKSSKTQYSEEVDKVFELIFGSKELGTEIFNFTQTTSMLKDVGSTSPRLIGSDIEEYVKANKVTDATIGNTQLIWDFQNDYSKEIRNWLQKKITIDEALKTADMNKENSTSYTY